jgi:hypothetical protein
LYEENPRLATSGIFGVYCYGIEGLKQAALSRWRQLLQGDSEGGVLAGLELLEQQHESKLLLELTSLLNHPSVKVQRSVLGVLGDWPELKLPDLCDDLEKLFQGLDPEVRRRAVKCFRLLASDDLDRLCLLALEDPHPHVRDAALEVMRKDNKDFWQLLSAWVIGNAGSPRAQMASIVGLKKYHPMPHVFEQIAEAKAMDARELDIAARALRKTLIGQGREDSGARLLEILLTERCQQVVDLALLALEYSGDPGTIEVIRAGLNSGDQAQVANASEALRNLNSRVIAETLGNILEGIDSEAGDSDVAPIQLDTRAEVLRWCASRPDAWLRECAAQVAVA